jgi:hypothetical protein
MQPVAYSNKTSSAAVKSAPGTLFGLVLAAGSDAATLIVYDNTAGSGTIIAKLSAIANGSAAISLPFGVSFGKGCYVALTGTSPSASVFYV